MTPAISKPLPAQLLSPQRVRDQQRSVHPEPPLTKLLDRSGMELRKQSRGSGDMGMREIKPPTADRPADTRGMAANRRGKEHPTNADVELQHVDRRQLRRPQPQEHSFRRQIKLNFEEQQKHGEIEARSPVANRSQRPSPSASQRQLPENLRPVQVRASPAGQQNTFTTNSPRPMAADTPRSGAMGSHIDSARSSQNSPKRFINQTNESPNQGQKNLNSVSSPPQFRQSNEIPQSQKRKPWESSVTSTKKADISLTPRVSPVETSSSPHNILPKKVETNTPIARRQPKPTSGTARNFGEETVLQSVFPHDENASHFTGKRDATLKVNSRIPTLQPNRNSERSLLAPRNLSVVAERKTKQVSEDVDDYFPQNSNRKLSEKQAVMNLDISHGHGIKSTKIEQFKLSQQSGEKSVITRPQNKPSPTDAARTRNQIGKDPPFDKRNMASPSLRNTQEVVQEIRGPDKGLKLERNIPMQQKPQGPLAVTVAKYPPSSATKPGPAKDTSEISPMKQLRKATNLTVRNEKSEQQTKLQIPSPIKPVLVSTATSPINSPRFSQATPRTNSSRTDTLTEYGTALPVASNMTDQNVPSATLVKLKKNIVPSKQAPISSQGLPINSTKTLTAFAATPHQNLSTHSPVLGAESTQKQQRQSNVNQSIQAEAFRNQKGKPKIISHKTGLREPASTNPQLGEKLTTTAKTHHQHHKEPGYQHYINELPDLPEINENNPRTMSAKSPPLEQTVRESQGKNNKKTAEDFPEHPLRMRISSFEASRKQATNTKIRKGVTATQAEAPRGKQKRSSRARAKTQPSDVAAALPDVTGNFTSAVHQWLSRSHYTVVRPQHMENLQQDTIEEEKVKELKKKKNATAAEDHVLEMAGHTGATEENADWQTKTECQRAATTARRQQKESNTSAKRTSSTRPIGKGSKAGIGYETTKVKPVSRKHSKTRPTRRKKESLRVGSEGLSGAQPQTKKLPKGSGKARRHKAKSRRGPAGDSGDFLSTSSSTGSYLSVSDDIINEQSAV